MSNHNHIIYIIYLYIIIIYNIYIQSYIRKLIIRCSSVVYTTTSYYTINYSSKCTLLGPPIIHHAAPLLQLLVPRIVDAGPRVASVHVDPRYERYDLQQNWMNLVKCNIAICFTLGNSENGIHRKLS